MVCGAYHSLPVVVAGLEISPQCAIMLGASLLVDFHMHNFSYPSNLPFKGLMHAILFQTNTSEINFIHYIPKQKYAREVI